MSVLDEDSKVSSSSSPSRTGARRAELLTVSEKRLLSVCPAPPPVHQESAFLDQLSKYCLEYVVSADAQKANNKSSKCQIQSLEISPHIHFVFE